MIIGKHSALKGFGLFFYALITILVLICTVNVGPFWAVVGITNAVVNTWVIVALFRYWTKLSINK